jgi:peroxiredoxin
VFENAPFTAQQRELEVAMADDFQKFFERSKKEPGYDSVTFALSNLHGFFFNERTKSKIDFIKKHPDYYVSLFWFRYWVTDRIINLPDSALALFKRLDPKLQQLPEGQAVLQRITNKIALAENRTLPQFSLPDSSGNLITQANFKKKYLLIDFWASWCGPCLVEMPEVKKLYAQFGHKNLDILGVSLDHERDKWLRSVKKYDIRWTQVSELKGWNGMFTKQLDVFWIPQYYLVDPQGKFVLMGASIEDVQKYMEGIDLSIVRDR